MKILLCKTDSNSSAFASQCYSLMSKRRVSKELADENDDDNDDGDDHEEHAHDIAAAAINETSSYTGGYHPVQYYTDMSDEKAVTNGVIDIEMEESKIVKRLGRVKKKLKGIKHLEQKYNDGEKLLPNQVQKIQQKLHYQQELQQCKQEIFNLRKYSERLQWENDEMNSLQRELIRMRSQTKQLKLENDALKQQNLQLQDDQELNVEDKHFIEKLFSMQCVKQRDHYKLQA
eukprot:CAMPEP_0202732872 /NCGR_PEP_ID=MMETSP1385-20130828/187880_1 /ASSEMBLY_ACC=CAM_ASM_000861 /TAXON_ID=933848 /ORGANISM="Elphidium margaritaceum" /LENGTH=230 /DNA_ID=CAMNT_0049399195 /DNA_START=369 /DNA_END=1058 /DNA_ORIENTATION=-